MTLNQTDPVAPIRRWRQCGSVLEAYAPEEAKGEDFATAPRTGDSPARSIARTAGPPRARRAGPSRGPRTTACPPRARAGRGPPRDERAAPPASHSGLECRRRRRRNERPPPDTHFASAGPSHAATKIEPAPAHHSRRLRRARAGRAAYWNELNLVTTSNDVPSKGRVSIRHEEPAGRVSRRASTRGSEASIPSTAAPRWDAIHRRARRRTRRRAPAGLSMPRRDRRPSSGIAVLSCVVDQPWARFTPPLALHAG